MALPTLTSLQKHFDALQRRVGVGEARISATEAAGAALAARADAAETRLTDLEVRVAAIEAEPEPEPEPTPEPGPPPPEPAFTVTDYTDAAQAVPWGSYSHWLQPGRAWSETPPASRLTDALGVNLNVYPQEAEATCRLLAANGFKRARIEVSWNGLDYTDPSTFKPSALASLEAFIGAMKRHGIRPLVLLNGNSGLPCPYRTDVVTVIAPATAGSTIKVRPSDVSKIVPGRSGFQLPGQRSFAAAHIITSVAEDGTCQLSYPIGPPQDTAGVPVGNLMLTTLRFEPFRSEGVPAGEETIEGWVTYAHTVAREVSRILGSDEFDVEVWNELSFGSQFLYLNAYYSPGVSGGGGRPEGRMIGDVVDLMAAVHPGVKVSNGFASERPWDSGTFSHPGLGAISKHAYKGPTQFDNSNPKPFGIRPLDALGQHDDTRIVDAAGHVQYAPNWTPSYRAYFPEYWLSGLQTETYSHDLSPTPVNVAGQLHGRTTGNPPPEIWITETNQDPPPGASVADRRHIMTKNVLREFVTFANKGVTAVHFYGTKGAPLNLVDDAFFKSYADVDGGETVAALGRLTSVFSVGAPPSAPRSITLDALGDFEENTQFRGDGSPGRPDLYDRDVLLFLPFQVTDDRFVVSVHIQSRDIGTVYSSDAGPGRFDMPEATYRFTVGGVAPNALVALYDPIRDQWQTPTIVDGEKLTFDAPIVDYPRLLTIQEW